jgi:hypothetical protein
LIGIARLHCLTPDSTWTNSSTNRF